MKKVTGSACGAAAGVASGEPQAEADAVGADQAGADRAATRRRRKARAKAAGLGRSRGGLSSKIHAAVDCAGLPLAFVLTPGQAYDKSPESFEAGLHLRGSIMWLKHLTSTT